jgi:hypothetical protein
MTASSAAQDGKTNKQQNNNRIIATMNLNMKMIGLFSFLGADISRNPYFSGQPQGLPLQDGNFSRGNKGNGNNYQVFSFVFQAGE